MYDIEFNGITSGSKNLTLYEYPSIEQAKHNYTINNVPGVDGGLLTDYEYKDPITISCTFSVISDRLTLSLHEIKRWLTGMGTLKMSDDMEYYYEVKRVDHDNMERELFKYGRFTANFICYPYQFHNSGAQETSNLPIYNQFDLCKPIYRIAGEGVCCLTVNGKQMAANIGQNITIDTRRMIAYRVDGEPQDAEITGEYSDLWLPSGKVEINVTNGFDLFIKTEWGYYA